LFDRSNPIFLTCGIIASGSIPSTAGDHSICHLSFSICHFPFLIFIMRKRTLTLLALAAGAGAATLIYRNWRHIVRHPLKLSPATHAIGVERNIPIEVEHGLVLMADQPLFYDYDHPSALILPISTG
jgi:hypothetical protein